MALRWLDFAVVGGGPAGCAAAITLARQGARVGLLERSAAPAFKPGEIIDPAIFSALEDLGLEDSFKGLGFNRLAGNVSVWDSDERVEAFGARNPHGHGVLIDRARFEGWLLDETRTLGVEVMCDAARVSAARSRSGSAWQITVETARLDGQTSWEAGFIVEATGRSAGLVAPPERQVADQLVCMLAYPDAPAGLFDSRLHLEAVDVGWWYAASLPGRKLVIALVIDRSTASGMDAPTRAAWFWREYGKTQLLSEWARWPASGRAPSASDAVAGLPAGVRGFPANSSIRHMLHGPGWVAIGDAAASYDPLLGRGVPLALTKGAAAGRLLSSGGDLDRQARCYADAEREAFAHYLDQHRETYDRAGKSRPTRFWLSLQSQARDDTSLLT